MQDTIAANSNKDDDNNVNVNDYDSLSVMKSIDDSSKLYLSQIMFIKWFLIHSNINVQNDNNFVFIMFHKLIAPNHVF